MSTFYLLPPRPVLGARFACYLESLFPGLDWASATWPQLADTLSDVVAGHGDVFVIYGEDLPPGEDPNRALADGFGAEPGDEVVEVQPGSKPGEVTTRRWRLEAGA